MRPLTRIVVVGTVFVVALMTAVRWTLGPVAVVVFLAGLLVLWGALELVVRRRERRSGNRAPQPGTRDDAGENGP